MLTFRQFIGESVAAAVGITAQIASLNRQVQQDRTATKAEKILSSQSLWLATMIAFGMVTGQKNTK